MLDYKLIVGQFRWFLCAVGMRSSKTRDQPWNLFARSVSKDQTVWSHSKWSSDFQFKKKLEIGTDNYRHENGSYDPAFRQFTTTFSQSDWFYAVLKINTEHGGEMWGLRELSQRSTQWLARYCFRALQYCFQPLEKR